MRTSNTILALALIIVAGLGCRKSVEHIDTEVLTKQAETKKPDASRYASTVLSPETMAAYNWSQQTALTGGNGRLIGVKVPAATKADTENEVTYLIVHMQDDTWGDVIEHRIRYTEDQTTNRTRPSSITSRNLITKETATKSISRNEAKRPEKGGTGIERKSLVAPGGTLPLITIVGTYSDGSAGGQFTMTSPTDYILIAGALSAYSSNPNGGLSNYNHLDYLDPLYVPSAGGSSPLQPSYSSIDTRFINGFVYRQGDHPGVSKGFPWLWWENTTVQTDANFDYGIRNFITLQTSLNESTWLVQNAEPNKEIFHFLIAKDYEDDAKVAAKTLVKHGTANLTMQSFGAAHFEGMAVAYNEIYDQTFPNPGCAQCLADYVGQLTVRMAYLKQDNPSWSTWRCYLEAHWEIIHLTLDILGMIPVGGEVFDVANGVLYTIRGDGVNAGLSYAGAVPFFGWGATTAKWARKAIHLSNGDKIILGWQKVGNRIHFGNRGDLRKVLELNPGMPNQAHHIIPWDLQTHPVIQMAASAKNPFHMNELKNGFPLHTSRHHGSHPNYSSLVQDKLDNILDELGHNADPNLVAARVRALTEQITNAIRTQGHLNINDVTF